MNEYLFDFIKVNNLNEPGLEAYSQKNEVGLLRANEPDPGFFICESSKVILRALDAGYEPVSVLTAIEEPDPETAAVYERCKNVSIYFAPDHVFRELSGYALTGGILAKMKRKPLPSMEETIKGKSLIAVLENVQNPTNIGAIFRSAAAMKVEAVIITSDCADPYYRRSERTSMGCVFQIPWTKTDKDGDYLKILKENGFATVAMALNDKAVSISDPAIKKEEKIAVILGNEGYGLKEDTVENSDYVAMIPMNPVVDSLNVSAAGAVMFWELSQKR